MCIVDNILITKCDLITSDEVHAMYNYFVALNFSFELSSLVKVLSDFS